MVGSQVNTPESSPSLTQGFLIYDFKDSISSVSFLLGINKILRSTGRMKLSAIPYLPKCQRSEKPVEIQKLMLREVPAPEDYKFWMPSPSRLHIAMRLLPSGWA